MFRGGVHEHTWHFETGDGVKTVYFLPKSPVALEVFVGGALQRPASPGVPNQYSLDGNKVTFVAAPGLGVAVGFGIVSG